MDEETEEKCGDLQKGRRSGKAGGQAGRDRWLSSYRAALRCTSDFPSEEGTITWVVLAPRDRDYFFHDAQNN